MAGRKIKSVLYRAPAFADLHILISSHISRDKSQVECFDLESNWLAGRNKRTAGSILLVCFFRIVMKGQCAQIQWCWNHNFLLLQLLLFSDILTRWWHGLYLTVWISMKRYCQSTFSLMDVRMSFSGLLKTGNYSHNLFTLSFHVFTLN